MLLGCWKTLVELYGNPTTIKSDNGPEFVAKKVQEWNENRHINMFRSNL